MEYFKLNDQQNIPKIGCGTSRYGKYNKDFFADLNDDTREMEMALSVGYRMFDTAIIYRNEYLVAQAIAASGIDRKEIFIESKIDWEEKYTRTDELVRSSIEGSLNRLNTDYIDLYLIHHPIGTNDNNLRVWKVMESYQEKGVFKSIGVSNFMLLELSYLIKHAKIMPAVNQVKSNPSNWNTEIIEYCKLHGILPQIYSPLRSVDDTFKKVLSDIGMPYGKSWAQVLLRYHIDNGCQVIPMSYDKQHQADNLNIFDFKLSKDEMNIIHRHK